MGTTGYNIWKENANNACSLLHHQALMQGMSLVPASFVTTLNVTALINRAHTKSLTLDTPKIPQNHAIPDSLISHPSHLKQYINVITLLSTLSSLNLCTAAWSTMSRLC